MLQPREPADEAAAAPALLELHGIDKRFGGVRALAGMRLAVRAGEVMALVGENGAGKSTLVKILTGIHSPDAGEVRLGGETIAFASPLAAMRAGITAVHQETVMFDELSVAENIYMGHHPLAPGGLPRIDWRRMQADAAKLFERLEVNLSPRAKVKDLSIAQRHFIEIARALSQEARVVIMDEPTAALSRREIDELYRIVAQLKAHGTAVIFITHKFDEIFAVADRYTVMRDGEFVAEGRIAETGEQQLIAMMVGRSITQVYPKQAAAIGATVLEVQGLSHPTEFDDVSFTLRRGEILGFYGLVGAGRSEVMQALFGLTPTRRGRVVLDGQPLVLRSPDDAIRAGIAYVPEDRQHQGAHLGLSIAHNVTLPRLADFGWWLLGKKARELALVRRFCERLELKAAHFGQTVSDLSGGNQQKVVLAKWLSTNPKVIVIDEPTKGIDVGSKAAVHQFISELVMQGLAVIMVSSELPEIMGLSDRIVVMHQGRVRREFTRAAATTEAVAAAALGAAA
ncbi:MAG TPA: sugar ABC transporter ATP-binding protein [Burkholderiaceae bacterium]|nr:sugar ABC transporter ATP-binding protein [Burkholderiaceae bacterium]